MPCMCPLSPPSHCPMWVQTLPILSLSWWNRTAPQSPLRCHCAPLLRSIPCCSFPVRQFLSYLADVQGLNKVALPTSPFFHPVLPGISLPALTELPCLYTASSVSCFLVWLLVSPLPRRSASPSHAQILPVLKGAFYPVLSPPESEAFAPVLIKWGTPGGCDKPRIIVLCCYLMLA